MTLVSLDAAPVDGVRVITLNDPDRRNAMSPELQADLGDAVGRVGGDADARVLVWPGTAVRSAPAPICPQCSTTSIATSPTSARDCTTSTTASCA